VTCTYLTKSDFRSCLTDETFHNVMETAALKTMRYREQRFGVSLSPDPKFLPVRTESVHRCQSIPPRYLNAHQMPVLTLSLEYCYPPLKKFSPFPFKTKRNKPHAQLVEGGDKVTKTKIINKYRIEKEIGKGSYSSVYSVVHVDTGTRYAMKVINKARKGPRRDRLRESFRREVAVMKKLRHPNIVTLWEVYMIQEFMEKGSILPEYFYVEPLSEQVALSTFTQASRGLHYLHRHGICHGDIKPSNLLQGKDGQVKIGDFGACFVLKGEGVESFGIGDSGSGSGEEMKGQEPRKKASLHHEQIPAPSPYKQGKRYLVGTPAFLAPELFGKDAISNISFASDLWALGISLYQMVVGRTPWIASTLTELQRAVRFELLTFPEGHEVEPHIINLLHRMLDKDPARRITLEGAMRHDWVTREGVCPLDFEQ
ncbi:unnamed protein product, partial [Discosporangium mesarthrocarpum]